MSFAFLFNIKSAYSRVNAAFQKLLPNPNIRIFDLRKKEELSGSDFLTDFWFLSAGKFRKLKTRNIEMLILKKSHSTDF